MYRTWRPGGSLKSAQRFICPDEEHKGHKPGGARKCIYVSKGASEDQHPGQPRANNGTNGLHAGYQCRIAAADICIRHQGHPIGSPEIPRESVDDRRSDKAEGVVARIKEYRRSD